MRHITIKYRLMPTRAQETTLNQTLEICRQVYNSLLLDRNARYEITGKGPSRNEQAKYLTHWKNQHPELAKVYGQVLSNVATRVDLAFQAFFRRVKSGETPGYPRSKRPGEYDSLTYDHPSKGYWFRETALTLSKIGDVPAVFHRPLPGDARTCTIVKQSGKWYACIVCQCEDTEPLPATGKRVGVDVGVKVFAALSDGTMIENPHHYARDQKELARVQRKVAAAAPGSAAREKARRALNHIHERVRCRRADFIHKQSRQIVNDHDLIAVEDLQIKNLVKKPKAKPDPEQERNFLPNGARAKASLNRSMADASWGGFREKLTYKAAWTGRRLVAVAPAYTSQDCSGCGKRVPKALSVRTHVCTACGLVVDRDTNAAKNILAKALIQPLT